MKFDQVAEIIEEIQPLKNGKKGCVLFDLDDCLLKADGSLIGIWKEKPGEQPIRLSTEQYAKDPDAATHKDWFSYKEFRDPEKVYASIVGGTPLLRQLRLLDAHVKANYDIAFLTARGLQDVVDKALKVFLKYRDKDGNLQPIGDKLKSDISAAVNDEFKAYPGATDPEKKANIIKKVCQSYDKVKFVDDDLKNVQAAKALKIPNLQVILARKDPLTKNISEDALNEALGDILEEEISKKVTKKLERLEKLATKFDKQARRANAKMMVYLRSKEGKEISEGKRKKLFKIALQLNKAQEELKNIKELKRFNDKSNPKTKDEIKKLEKEIIEELKETQEQIKDSMNDSIIKTILRDIGVFSIFVGLPSVLSAIMTDGIPVLGPVGIAVGIYNTGVTHHNREVRRTRALTTSRELKYSSKKETEED